MKSTIKFDLTEDNQPCIILNYEDSDDLRDKVVKKFIEGIGYNSNWLMVDKVCPTTHPNKFLLSPVGDDELLNTAMNIIHRLKETSINSIEEAKYKEASSALFAIHEGLCKKEAEYKFPVESITSTSSDSNSLTFNVIA